MTLLLKAHENHKWSQENPLSRLLLNERLNTYEKALKVINILHI